MSEIVDVTGGFELGSIERENSRARGQENRDSQNRFVPY
jgi:hypothetical protein